MKTRDISVLIRDNIKKIEPYSSARDEYAIIDDRLIYLDANENPFENGINRYPDSRQVKLRTLISELKNVPVDQILLGNGSDEILDLIFRAFCEPNKDNIITLPPTYGMYDVLANLNAIEIIRVNLDNNFEPKVDVILNTQNSLSKLLFLCVPNNPTANSFNSSKIEQLIREFNGIVIIDEAYIDFSEYESWTCKLNEFPNLIVVQTCSKGYGLAGIRLGMCYASEAIISILNSIKPPYNISQLTQEKAISKLLDISAISVEINKILEERKWMINELHTISIVNIIYPSSTNFLMVKVDDANKRYRQLIDKGIVVRNRTNQPLCKNCIRLTIGTPTENIRLIQTLKTLT